MDKKRHEELEMCIKAFHEKKYFNGDVFSYNPEYQKFYFLSSGETSEGFVSVVNGKAFIELIALCFDKNMNFDDFPEIINLILRGLQSKSKSAQITYNTEDKNYYFGCEADKFMMVIDFESEEGYAITLH